MPSGDSRSPLYFLIAACLVNVVLDLVFVLALDMGVEGVAIATSLAQLTSAVLVCRSLSRAARLLSPVLSQDPGGL